MINCQGHTASSSIFDEGSALGEASFAAVSKENLLGSSRCVKKYTMGVFIEQKVNHSCLKEILTRHRLSEKDGLMVDILELFGKRIRGLRRSKDLTQEQLAELAGISLQNMGEIERGKGNPTLVTLEKLSAALGEDLSSIFDLGNSALTKDQANQELMSLLSGATKEQAQAILVVAQVILQKK
jgi:transcriptional regulator with XRE-family HTH domain